MMRLVPDLKIEEETKKVSLQAMKYIVVIVSSPVSINQRHNIAFMMNKILPWTKGMCGLRMVYTNYFPLGRESKIGIIIN